MSKKLAISVSAAVLMSSTQAMATLEAAKAIVEATAVAEAMTTLEAARPIVEAAYRGNHNAFRKEDNSPLPEHWTSSKYVTRFIYASWNNPKSGPGATVMVMVGGTGNPMIDGASIALVGQGRADGTVDWECRTGSPPDREAWYRNVPVGCRH